jgi:pyridoxamine 5'-phosphate oxidase
MIARMEPTFAGPPRTDYGDAPLKRSDLLAEPLLLLQRWLAAAANAGVREPTAMALATCAADGQPRCRIVLCKAIDAGGLVFFTNAESDKGRELAAEPRAAATFWWPAPRERQVRIEGRVAPADDALADRYFASRPRQAQLASAASPQSRALRDRSELESLVAALAARIGDGPVPRPPHWRGYRLQPERVEFWQGRAARLHDRFRFLRDDAGRAGWRIERLAP